MPLHSCIFIQHFHKKSVPVFSQERIFFMAVSTAFPPACYKSDAFLLNRETISLQMELISAKICMDKHFWHEISYLKRIAMPKKSAPVFPQGRIFSRLFPLILPHKLEQLSGFSF
jgi:hypothetical protein